MESSMIAQLVKKFVENLVDNPDQIRIEEQSGERTTVINIFLVKEDVGKVIGRKGRIIEAIRTIGENISAKNQKRVSIHVID